jgi:copper homeostasis protein
MTTLEIAIETLEDAIAAEQGGANSVEVSRDLAHDGLTPSLALVRQIGEAVSIDVHVIVRPHARDFIYTPDELTTILEETAALIELGVTGIVFGAQTAQGTLDVPMIRQVAEAAASVQFTLHRAIDSAQQPQEALDALNGSLDRVLTSGPASTAWEGREGLRAWQQRFGDQMAFIAAGSIRADMLPELVTYTGVSGVHVGSAAREGGIVTVEKVAQLRRLLDKSDVVH